MGMKQLRVDLDLELEIMKLGRGSKLRFAAAVMWGCGVPTDPTTQYGNRQSSLARHHTRRLGRLSRRRRSLAKRHAGTQQR